MSRFDQLTPLLTLHLANITLEPSETFEGPTTPRRFMAPRPRKPSFPFDVSVVSTYILRLPSSLI